MLDGGDVRATAEAVLVWRAEGRSSVVARAVDGQGLGPHAADDLLAVDDRGALAGGLLAGLVAADVFAAAADLLRPEAPPDRVHLLLGSAVSFDAATAVGLTCGGTVRVLVQRTDAVPDSFWADLAAGRTVALATHLGDGAGVLVLRPGVGAGAEGTLGAGALDAAARAEADALFARPGQHRARTTVAGTELLVQVWNPTPHLLIVGVAALAEVLTAMVGLLGWTATTVADLHTARPAVERLGPGDAVVVLEHRPSIASPVLVAALRNGVGYVGALGSRRTRVARENALARDGLAAAEIARLHCPSGLDLGGRTPPETAVSIVAEILAERSGRDPRALRDTAGPIGA